MPGHGTPWTWFRSTIPRPIPNVKIRETSARVLFAWIGLNPTAFTSRTAKTLEQIKVKVERSTGG